MSHHRYQTEAIILGSSDMGEANRFIDMYTAELGRIRAVARSVREERSKLRFSLQDFSMAEVSLVRGREVWRIVGAESGYNFHNEFKENNGETKTALRMVSLLKRLLNGEEENRELFTVVSDAFSFLKTSSLSDEELSSFECLVVLRILYNLGYVAKDSTNARFLDTADIHVDLMSHISPMREDVIKQINTSLQESQL